MYIDDKGHLKVRGYSCHVIYDKETRDRFPSTVQDDLTLSCVGVILNNIWRTIHNIDSIFSRRKP